jgi:hypothetical protein
MFTVHLPPDVVHVKVIVYAIRWVRNWDCYCGYNTTDNT